MKKKSLPLKFKKYFWDVDFKDVVARPYSKFALERIMNLGNFSALRWLLKTVPPKIINKVVATSRELDQKTKNFWRIIYGKEASI